MRSSSKDLPINAQKVQSEQFMQSMALSCGEPHDQIESKHCTAIQSADKFMAAQALFSQCLGTSR
eukprot:scaffold454838_cov20-Prasinocladus_malaysianus.AAC.1